MRKQKRVIGDPQPIPHSMMYSTSTAPDNMLLTYWILSSCPNQCFWTNSWNDPSIPNPFLMLTRHCNLFYQTVSYLEAKGRELFFPE